ncbi:hypothetical protein B0H14DRAFT_3467498 [Mycena olivaceomarginata]|nr:hypothetical protein B0H14DRAFT_3467498 [Mycena olivaceomarginata]
MNTPNDGGCACVAEKLGCGFVAPADGAFTVLVGTLVGEVYGLLPGVGGDCDDITANETTGVYGVMAMCDPVTRLSSAFSQYYELTARAATSCDFAGNATFNPTLADIAAPSDAVSSCLPSPTAVFIPSAVATANGSAGSESSGSSGSGSGSGSSGSSGSGGTWRWG